MKLTYGIKQKAVEANFGSPRPSVRLLSTIFAKLKRVPNKSIKNL